MLAATCLIAAIAIGPTQGATLPAADGASESAYRNALTAIEAEDYDLALSEAQQALDALSRVAAEEQQPTDRRLSLHEVEAIEAILKFESRTGRSELPARYIDMALDTLRVNYRRGHPRLVRLQTYLLRRSQQASSPQAPE